MDEVIRILNDNKIKYLLIGGQAIRLMGMPRFSMDWDIYIPGKDSENIRKINKCLENILDMDIEALGEKGQNFVQTFQTKHGIIQFHLAPVGLPPFEKAAKRARTFLLESGVAVKTVCEEDLYQCKLEIHRDKDKDDILFLRHLCSRRRRC